jgi:hypothetical protein
MKFRFTAELIDDSTGMVTEASAHTTPSFGEYDRIPLNHVGSAISLCLDRIVPRSIHALSHAILTVDRYSCVGDENDKAAIDGALETVNLWKAFDKATFGS